MSRILASPSIALSVNIRLNEQELRALHALTEYGTEAFLDNFYAHMGTSALKPHEEGLRSIFAMLRSEAPTLMSRADTARAAFEKP